MYRAIAVGTDGSPTATEAVRRAGELGRALDVAVHVITAYRPSTVALAAPEGMVPLAECMEILEDQAHDVVHRAVDGLLAEGAKAVGHVVGGAPAQAIMRIAQAEGADLIVVGNKGMRGVRRLLGSIPNAVSHGAGCDVLIVSTT